MSKSASEIHQMQHPEVGGVDARATERESQTLDEVETEARVQLSRTSILYFVLVVVAIAAAIGAVVAVIGPDRLI